MAAVDTIKRAIELYEFVETYGIGITAALAMRRPDLAVRFNSLTADARNQRRDLIELEQACDGDMCPECPCKDGDVE